MVYAKSIAINYLGRIEPDNAPSRFERFQKRSPPPRRRLFSLSVPLRSFSSQPIRCSLSCHRVELPELSKTQLALW